MDKCRFRLMVRAMLMTKIESRFRVGRDKDSSKVSKGAYKMCKW